MNGDGAARSRGHSPWKEKHERECRRWQLTVPRWKTRKVAKKYAKNTERQADTVECVGGRRRPSRKEGVTHTHVHDCVTDVIILRNSEPSSGICKLHACESELAEQYAQQFALIRYRKLGRGKSDVRC